MIWTRAGGAPSAAGCPNNPPTPRPGPRRSRRAGGKGPLDQGGANLAHEIQVEMEVVHGRELGSQHLTAEHEMPERDTAEMPAGVARTVVLDGTRIAGVRGIANHELALAGEQRPVATVARRQNAIEEIVSHGHEAKQIARRPGAPW